MNMSISERDIRDIKDYINSGKLIKNMNENGLSFESMAIILQTVMEKCDEIIKEFQKGENNEY